MIISKLKAHSRRSFGGLLGAVQPLPRGRVGCYERLPRGSRDPTKSREEAFDGGAEGCQGVPSANVPRPRLVRQQHRETYRGQVKERRERVEKRIEKKQAEHEARGESGAAAADPEGAHVETAAKGGRRPGPVGLERSGGACFSFGRRPAVARQAEAAEGEGGEGRASKPDGDPSARGRATAAGPAGGAEPYESQPAVSPEDSAVEGEERSGGEGGGQGGAHQRASAP